MRHEITTAEATTIRKAQSEWAVKQQAEREKAQLEKWLGEQELRHNTQ